MPKKFFVKTRWFWVWVTLEFKTKYGYDFVVNRNDVESLYRNNYVAFFAMWYLESAANMTANITEGLLYGSITPL